MQMLTLALTIYGAAVLEFSGIGADPRGIEPRWLLLAAAHIAWTQRSGAAILAAGLCGLCQAVSDGRDLGLCVAVVAVCAALLGGMRRSRRWSSGTAYLVSVFTCTTACVLAIDGAGILLHRTVFPEPNRWLLAAGAQGAMSALCGGGCWCLGRFVTALRNRLLPPLDWRPSRS